MDNRFIQVPASLLLDPNLTTQNKVIWMVRHLLPEADPARVQALTGFCRQTVLNGLAWVAGFPAPRGWPKVRMPVALLTEPGVGARAKEIYGFLQTVPTFRGNRGQFTYAGLSAMTRLGPNTLKRAMADLTGSGWVRTTQKSRLGPIHFKLGTPEQRRREAEAAVAERRLRRALYGGEAIMQEYLSLLVDSKDFADNIRPGFLVNPLTQERLELDRYYRSHQVAFEFHGDQHDRASDQFSQRDVDDQRLRDLIKAGLCVYEGIRLVIVRAENLSLQGMIRKIGQGMPLRDLTGQERLIDHLEDASLKYVASARPAGPGKARG